MRRLTPAALLVAGALLLSACGSDSGTSANSSSAAAPTSAATSSVTASSGVSGSGVGQAPDTTVTTRTTSSAGTAALIDAQTTAWFDAFCTEIAPIKVIEGIGGESAGQDAAAQWEAKLSALQTLSQAFSATSTRLATTPPPTFDGGTDFAEKLTTGLSNAASNLSAAADKFGAVDPTDATALATAQPAFTADVLEAVAALQAVSTLDPSVVAAIRGIPSCQSLGV